MLELRLVFLCVLPSPGLMAAAVALTVRSHPRPLGGRPQAPQSGPTCPLLKDNSARAASSKHANTYIYIYTCLSICITCMSTHVDINKCIYTHGVCVHIYIYRYIYVSIYGHVFFVGGLTLFRGQTLFSGPTWFSGPTLFSGQPECWAQPYSWPNLILGPTTFLFIATLL